jgi:hypothetical protein
MKWFKHDTDAEDSEGLNVLIDNFGMEGYGRWFRLLETIAKKMERGSNRCHVEYTEGKWCEILKTKRKKLSCFLTVIQKQLKTKVKRKGNKLRIECPNLLKKRDEYSERTRYSPDKVSLKNKEKRIKNKLIRKVLPPPGVDPEQSKKWSKCLGHIEAQILPENFTTLFETMAFAGVMSGKASLICSDKDHSDCLSENYTDLIQATMTEIFDKPLTPEFVIEARL